MNEDDRRRQIVRTAANAFLDRGYRAVSMSDLAADLAVSKRTLYEHFETKEALLQAVVDRFMDALERGGDELMADDTLSLEERIERIGETLAAHLQHVDRRFVEEMERSAPRVARRLGERRRRRMHEMMHRLISEGQKQGVVRSDIPAEVVIEMLVACTDQLATADALRRMPLAPRDVPPLILRTLLHGILAGPGQAPSRP